MDLGLHKSNGIVSVAGASFRMVRRDDDNVDRADIAWHNALVTRAVDPVAQKCGNGAAPALVFIQAGKEH